MHSIYLERIRWECMHHFPFRIPFLGAIICVPQMPMEVSFISCGSEVKRLVCMEGEEYQKNPAIQKYHCTLCDVPNLTSQRWEMTWEYVNCWSHTTLLHQHDTHVTFQWHPIRQENCYDSSEFSELMCWIKYDFFGKDKLQLAGAFTLHIKILGRLARKEKEERRQTPDAHVASVATAHGLSPCRYKPIN